MLLYGRSERAPRPNTAASPVSGGCIVRMHGVGVQRTDAAALDGAVAQTVLVDFDGAEDALRIRARAHHHVHERLDAALARDQVLDHDQVLLLAPLDLTGACGPVPRPPPSHARGQQGRACTRYGPRATTDRAL